MFNEIQTYLIDHVEHIAISFGVSVVLHTSIKSAEKFDYKKIVNFAVKVFSQVCELVGLAKKDIAEDLPEAEEIINEINNKQ